MIFNTHPTQIKVHYEFFSRKKKFIMKTYHSTISINTHSIQIKVHYKDYTKN